MAEDSKLIIESCYFSQGKRYQSEKIALSTQKIRDLGGQIKVCKPAFAYGCETPIAVRQAIRAGR